MLPEGGVLRGKRNGRGKGVVRLMHRFIEERVMEEAMKIICDDLPNEDAEYDVSNDLCKTG